MCFLFVYAFLPHSHVSFAKYPRCAIGHWFGNLGHFGDAAFNNVEVSSERVVRILFANPWFSDEKHRIIFVAVSFAFAQVSSHEIMFFQKGLTEGSPNSACRLLHPAVLRRPDASHLTSFSACAWRFCSSVCQNILR